MVSESKALDKILSNAADAIASNHTASLKLYWAGMANGALLAAYGSGLINPAVYNLFKETLSAWDAIAWDAYRAGLVS